MAEVKLVNVKKIYPFVSGEEKKSKKKKKGEEPAEEKKVNLQITDKGVVAVQEFNLDIADKEFIVLVGPSGCGKSTTLRMVAGLEEISEGELYIDGKLMNDVAPKDRDIAMVFQNYALYPHMTVYDNMAFSLKLKKTPKAEIDRKVREAAEILDITQYLNRKPKALSGGQRQRVAIGRAIVRNPKVFLMDEPLSNLDAKLRNQMRAEIIKLREKIDTTFIYVTHDQVEAMTLGDRIVIMRDGFIQQIGTPQEVFNHPANLFVAGFIGTPQMNFFDATLAKKGDKYVATVQGKDFELPADKQEALKKMDKIPTDIIAGVRPVHVHLSDDGIDATVDVSELMGSELHLHVNSNGKDVVIVVPTTDIDVGAVHGGHKPVKYSFRPELMAGDQFHVIETEQEAREIANKREQLQREQGLRTQKRLTLGDISHRIARGEFHELNVIVKGDTDGSVEALSDSFIKLSTEKVQVNVVNKAVGQISENDVMLASASDAVIVGFQVRPSADARKAADREGVEINTYSIIYDAIDDIKSAMVGMLDKVKKEIVTGQVEVKQTFKISKVGTIAGGLVTEGKVHAKDKARVIRDGIVIRTAEIGALKRYKDDVKEVVTGMECGLSLVNYNDIQEGDVIETFTEIEVEQKL